MAVKSLANRQVITGAGSHAQKIFAAKLWFKLWKVIGDVEQGRLRFPRRSCAENSRYESFQWKLWQSK